MKNSAGLCHPFQPRRDVDPVAVDVLALDDNVADIDADAKPDRLAFRRRGIALADHLLDLDGAGHRVDGAGELDERAIPHQLDHTAGMRGDRRVDDVSPQRLQALERTRLVGLHQPGITNDIGSQNGRQTALCAAFSHSTPSWAAADR